MTTLLAQLLGAIMVAVGIGLLINPKLYQDMIKDFTKSSGLMYLAGIFTMLIGLLMVLSHNVWELSVVGLVTLLGWMTLVKGTIILVFPKVFEKIGQMFSKCKNIGLVAGLFAIALGGYLGYFGFFA